MDVNTDLKVVAGCDTPPTTPPTKAVDAMITEASNTHNLEDKAPEANSLFSTPPPEPAGPAVQHPAFSYAHYTSNGKPIKLHHCRDLESFAAAVELLKGEKYLGIDIEHQPFGARKGQTPLPQSEAAKQLAVDTTTIGLKTFRDFVAAQPDEKVKLIHKKNAVPTGFYKIDDRAAYARFTRYAKTKLSVLQIASSSHIIVAHLAAFPHDNEILDHNEFIPPALKTILANATILKMGVQLAGEQSDMHNCSRYFEMPSNGLLELTHLDALLEGRDNDVQPKPSLKSLAEKWLGYTLIGKGYGSTTTSEWQLASCLSEEQVVYAANDAFVSVKIYQAMMHKYTSMSPKPVFPALLSESAFEYTAWLDKRVAELEARGTKSAKKALCALGIKGEPSIPLNVPEGGSKTYAQSQKRRAAMAPENAAMAEALSEVRDKLMKTYDIAVKRWILDDRAIDKIAVARPRPKHEDDFKVMTSAGVWDKMEPYADVFLDMMVNQEMLSELL